MTQQNPQEEKETSNSLLIFIGGSAALVAITLVVFVVVIALGRMPTMGERSGFGPYSVINRPVPTTNQLDQVLPESDRRFQTHNNSGSIQDFSATYTRNADKITLAGSQAVSLRAAQASVAQVARIGGLVSSANQQLKAPSYYLNNANKGAVRFVWSHDRRYVDVQANSQQGLDDFMRDFKY